MAARHADTSSGHSHQSPELRIVLIGGRQIYGDPSHKSASGNIILGKSVFDTNRRTAQSVAKQQEVHGRQVTVVDSPGWWWHYPRENTPKLDQIELENSIYLCPPGPHAFLLVIPLGLPIYQIYVSSLKEHLMLFHKEVFNHTIVVFNVSAQWSNESVEDYTSQWPALQWILKQCGNRKHVLSIGDEQDSTQVMKLFQKIDAMVAENGGGHFFIDSSHGNALREETKTVAEGAIKRSEEVQTQRRKLKALIEGGKTPPAHLRLVMVGAQWSAKSSAGNTILGRNAFAFNRGRTEYCHKSHGTVADRKLTVVDSPGWFYNHTLEETSEMDKLEIEKSMYLCPPGPHAVLLVIGLSSAFNASYQRALQEHMSLFTDDVWKHMIVLFTRGDWLGLKTVEERIESEKGLHWLMNKCGNRYHVLDNTNRRNESQVKELLEKIEEMWAGNENPYYEVNAGRATQIEAKMEIGERLAKMMRQTTERQSRILRELFKDKRKPMTDLRIVLVGKKESGKSMAGNRILFDEAFDIAWMKKEFQDRSSTTVCVEHKASFNGVNVTAVEAPGWRTDTRALGWLKGEVLQSVSMCAPGPHVFLLVVPISKAFTAADRKAVTELLMPFSERVWRHCMVLFTWGDWLNNKSIEQHIAGESPALRWLVEQCGNRYHVLSCNRFVEPGPVKELLSKIFDMITRNKGHCFTTDGKQEKKLKLPWQAKQPMLTEEQWNKREQELIDRMLKAIANEPEDSTLPYVKRKSSIDGAYIPSMSGGALSEYESIGWGQSAGDKVYEWLRTQAGMSDSTSGFGTMSASASYVEKLDESPLTDGKHQQTSGSVWEKDKYVRVSTNPEETQRRHSC